MRTKPLSSCIDYNTIKEATDMLNFKQLSVASCNEFGFCYISSNSKCKTDLLWERLALPIHDIRGNLIAYAGRKLETREKYIQQSFKSKYLDQNMAQAKIDKWNKSKWLNEPYEKSKHLFNFHRAYPYIMNKGYIIVVEGYFDVVGLYNKGIKNVVATCGTNLSRYQAFLIKAICDHCMIMYDGDEAGIKASFVSSETLNTINFPYTIITLDNSLDPDDYIKKKNPRRFLQILDDLYRHSIEQVTLT